MPDRAPARRDLLSPQIIKALNIRPCAATRIARPSRLCRIAPIAFTGTLAAAAKVKAHRRPARFRSRRRPALPASGAAAGNSFHSILYGTSLSTPAASITAANCPSDRRPAGWSARDGDDRAQQDARNRKTTYHSAATPGRDAPAINLPRARDELAAIIDRVDQRIETTNEEMADAEIVVIAEHFGDLLGRSDQGRGIAVGAGEFGDLGPQPLVDPSARRPATAAAAHRRSHDRQPVCDSRSCPAARSHAPEFSSAFAHALSSVSAMDRTNRQAKARGRPAVFRGSGANPRRHIAHLRIGFAPQREGIGMLARDFDRGIGSAADEGVDASGVIGLDLGKALLDL